MNKIEKSEHGEYRLHSYYLSDNSGPVHDVEIWSNGGDDEMPMTCVFTASCTNKRKARSLFNALCSHDA